MKWLSKIPLFFLSFALVFISVGKVLAETPEEQRLKEEIEELTKKVAEVQGQAKTLAGQISNFNNQIKLTELKIGQTEDEIASLSGKIDKLEGSIVELSDAHQERVISSYKLSRVGDTPLIFLLTSQDLTSLFSRFHYLQLIQDRDRDLLLRLQNSQTSLEQEKLDFEELSKKLETQKSFLANQRGAKENLLSVTKNDEKRYQQLLSQAKAQLAAFSKFTTSQGGATILSNQTKCEGWGCYYNQRDSLWGNMALGGTNYSMKDSGCFITSVAMLASHAGKSIKPSDIAQLSAAVTSGGDTKWSFSVNGINVSISGPSKSIIDSELNAGRPVMAGLYGGPAHWIVLLKKDGDKYIMHDPFLENGSNKTLSDKYNFSDITAVRLVSFN